MNDTAKPAALALPSLSSFCLLVWTIGGVFLLLVPGVFLRGSLSKENWTFLLAVLALCPVVVFGVTAALAFALRTASAVFGAFYRGLCRVLLPDEVWPGEYDVRSSLAGVQIDQGPELLRVRQAGAQAGLFAFGLFLLSAVLFVMHSACRGFWVAELGALAPAEIAQELGWQLPAALFLGATAWVCFKEAFRVDELTLERSGALRISQWSLLGAKTTASIERASVIGLHWESAPCTEAAGHIGHVQVALTKHRFIKAFRVWFYEEPRFLEAHVAQADAQLRKLLGRSRGVKSQ